MLLSVTTTSLGLTVHKNFQVVTSKEFFPVKLSNLYSTYIYIFKIHKWKPFLPLAKQFSWPKSFFQILWKSRCDRLKSIEKNLKWRVPKVGWDPHLGLKRTYWVFLLVKYDNFPPYFPYFIVCNACFLFFSSRFFNWQKTLTSWQHKIHPPPRPPLLLTEPLVTLRRQLLRSFRWDSLNPIWIRHVMIICVSMEDTVIQWHSSASVEGIT